MDTNLNTLGDKKPNTLPNGAQPPLRTNNPAPANPGTQASNTSQQGTGATRWQEAAAQPDKQEEKLSPVQAQFQSDLSAFVNDVEALLGRAGTLSSEALQASKEQLAVKAQNIKKQLGELSDKATESTNRTVEITQNFVRESPLKSIGLAVGVGAVLGLLFSRRSSN